MQLFSVNNSLVGDLYSKLQRQRGGEELLPWSIYNLCLYKSGFLVGNTNHSSYFKKREGLNQNHRLLRSDLRFQKSRNHRPLLKHLNLKRKYAMMRRTQGLGCCLWSSKVSYLILKYWFLCSILFFILLALWHMQTRRNNFKNVASAWSLVSLVSNGAELIHI